MIYQDHNEKENHYILPLLAKVVRRLLSATFEEIDANKISKSIN
jgi:hypothetical protein